MQYFLKDALTEKEESLLCSYISNNEHGNLYQDPHWPSIFELNRFTQILYFWGEQSGEIKVSALVHRHKVPLIGWAKDTVSRGPVCSDANDLHDSICNLIKLLKAKGSISLQLNPYWSFPQAKEVENILSSFGFAPLPLDKGLHSHTLVINLQQSENEIYKSFRRFTREKLKKAAKLGMEVTPVENESEIQVFCKYYNKLASEKQFKLLPESFFIRLWYTYLKDQSNGVFLITRYDNKIISGLIVLRHNSRAVATFSASDDEGFPKIPKSQPNHWQAVKWAKENNCTLYDLGGFLPGAPEGSPLYGVNQFKIGFSKKQDDLVREHQRIFSPVRYRLLLKMIATLKHKIATRKYNLSGDVSETLSSLLSMSKSKMTRNLDLLKNSILFINRKDN